MPTCRTFDVDLNGLHMKQFANKVINMPRAACSPLRRRFSSPTNQKRIIQFIVCLALLLDNMLYMVIVPIIDNYFPGAENSTNVMKFSDLSNSADHTTLALPLSSNVSQLPYGQGNLDPGSAKNSELPFIEKLKRIIRPIRIQDNKDGMMGLLFASKAIVQLCINPFTGALIDRIGYIMPLTMGLMVMFVSTSVFAGAQSYGWLFVARSLQGVGSALADTASFGLIADRFQNEAERSRALGIALAFISFGSLVAPPFGAVLYEFVGRAVPFIVLAITCLFNSALLLLVETPTDEEKQAKSGNKSIGTPIYKLLMDQYVLIIATSLTIANFPLAFLEPTIEEWMKRTMHARTWQIGLIWLPPFLPHVFGVFVAVKLSKKYFRYQWLYGAGGILFVGFSTILVPACKSVAVLIIPLSVMCFGIALIDTALLPTLAFLVDVRHTSVYGSVYAIADISYSVAYALGPILAGQAVQYLGYTNMGLFIGLANIFFVPLLLPLRKVYDWNVDRTERDMLIPHDENEPTNHQTTALDNETNGALPRSDRHTKYSEIDIENRYATECGSICCKTLTGTESNSIVSTSITPRPRPRQCRISQDRAFEADEERDF